MNKQSIRKQFQLNNHKLIPEAGLPDIQLSCNIISCLIPFIDISYIIGKRTTETDHEEAKAINPMAIPDTGPEPVINQNHYKRLIVKSPCFNVKVSEKQGLGSKRLFACGTQLGQIFIADVDEEPTDDHAKIYYFKQRYYSTTVFLDREKDDP